REPRALPPPRPEAWKALGPYARGSLVERAPGFPSLSLDVPWDVFSSQRIDEGTLLLLQHLPAGDPASLLDLGCGYGALGLPLAARWPHRRTTPALSGSATLPSDRASAIAACRASASTGSSATCLPGSALAPSA